MFLGLFLELSLRLKIVLNSMKKLKRYCKAILNVFLSKENFDDDKNVFYRIDFLCQNKK